MSLTATVTPGLVMAPGDLLDNDKVNAGCKPTVSLGGAADRTQVAADAFFYALDTGAVNAMNITLSPAITALVDGMMVYFKARFDTSGPTTLNVSGTGTKDVRKFYDQPLQAGDMQAG